ncbi:MAG TPA: hypothetical protein VEU28_03630 [Actinomycetota bacterium]|nr:hypothetical protein [Actinomycetota bacterium]
MAEEAKDAAGDPVITPKGRHRPEHMAVDVGEGTEYPQGVNQEGKVTAETDRNVNTGEGGGSETGQAVPGTV